MGGNVAVAVAVVVVVGAELSPPFSGVSVGDVVVSWDRAGVIKNTETKSKYVATMINPQLLVLLWHRRDTVVVLVVVCILDGIIML
jgi:hypothetical protein